MPTRRPLAFLALALALSGCLAGAEEQTVDPSILEAVAGTRAMTWASGNFWAYHAVFHEETPIDVALVVHRSDAWGFHLGSNASAGFFGLPFTGNVTPSLNPRIGPDEWPLYRFPLEDGKTWSYQMFGHGATTTARAALIDVPGRGPTPGFTLESASYGQVFARYDYTSETGWFTRLQLIEPTDGHLVLDVQLTAFGPDYAHGYYVEEPLLATEISCMDTPLGTRDIAIPTGYLRIHAILSATADGGLIDTTLSRDDGDALAHARAALKEEAIDRASVEARPETWRLDHTCVGLGGLWLEITGVSASGPLARAAGDAPALDLATLLAPALQSTRPDLPQLGHVTSTGLPVDV